MTKDEIILETIESVIDQYPGATQNNQRNLVRNLINRNANKMRRSPSETAAQRLESVGIAVDYQSSDAGEEPKHHDHE